MSKLLKSLLLTLVTVTLVYMSYQSYYNAEAYIQTSQEISGMNNTHETMQKKIDKLLEELSLGMYSQYTQNHDYLEAMGVKAAFYHQQSITWLYYFFGTVFLFILLFWLIDFDLMLIFIGLSALVALGTALFAPLLMMTVYSTVPLLGEVTLSYESKSIYSTIVKLFHQSNYLVGILVLLFSVLIPFFKSLLITTYGFLKETGFGEYMVTLIEKIGKWSMADVFIVAVLVVFFSTQQDIHTSLKIEAGLYFFTGYVLLSMLGSTLMGRVKKEAR